MPIHDWTRAEPGVFHSFHLLWMAEITRHLNNGVLPAPYYATPEKHGIAFFPDVSAFQSTDVPQSRNGSTPHSNRTAQLTVPHNPATAVSSGKLMTMQRTLGIREEEKNRLIAAIELVSPGNKDSRDQFDRFLHKCTAYLDAGVHLMVVDLFPPGHRDPQGFHSAFWTAISDRNLPFAPVKPLAVDSYEAADPVRAYVEQFSPGETFPMMPLFLGPNRCVEFSFEESYHQAWLAFPKPYRAQLEA
jgi:hypothetical protein